MYKKMILSNGAAFLLALASAAISPTVFASSQAEVELKEYLASIGLEDSFSWDRIEGDSLADATLYGVVYTSDKGSEDEQKYLIKKIDFDDYMVTDNRVSVKVKYQGVTDEDGEHLLLSKKLSPDPHFQSLGYQQLDDIQFKLKYDMEKTTGGLEGSFAIEQDDVLDGKVGFKTEGIGLLFDQLVALDVAALDPNLILVSAMSTKIHHVNLDLKDDGYNKRLLDSKPEHKAEVEKQYQSCLESLGQFGVKQLEQGCLAIKNYFLNKEDKLQIAMNPAKPFSVAEYMPMFMLLGNAGPDAVAQLVQKIVGELNLTISN